MDEKTFLRKWGEAGRALRCDVGDVRAKVWEGIARAQADSADAEQDFLPATEVLLKLDVAAVAVIGVGMGALYALLTDFGATVFWNQSFQSLVHTYL